MESSFNARRTGWRFDFTYRYCRSVNRLDIGVHVT
jgi:hypothetical protein